MIKPLLKISNDLDTQFKRKTKYTSSPGFVKHGIYIRENKETFEKLIILRGNLMRKYKYPKITTTFNSPLVNDYNLHLVGGWSWPNTIQEECIYRVLEGNKPMGFYCSFEKEKCDKLEELITSDGFWPHVRSQREIVEGKMIYEIGVCTPGLFEDIFDMDALLYDYQAYIQKVCVKYPNEYSDFVTDHIKQLSEEYIEDCLYYDYANPDSVEELITTGLMLGYPVESTVSILLME